MTDEWSNDQSTQITQLYDKLKGDYQKQANQKLFGGPQLPYSDAFSTLTNLIDEQEKKKGGGLEAAVQKKPASSGIFSVIRSKYAVGLAAAALLLGIPYFP